MISDAVRDTHQAAERAVMTALKAAGVDFPVRDAADRLIHDTAEHATLAGFLLGWQLRDQMDAKGGAR